MLENVRKCRKMLENAGKCWKMSEKCWKMPENVGKMLENAGLFWKKVVKMLQITARVEKFFGGQNLVGFRKICFLIKSVF